MYINLDEYTRREHCTILKMDLFIFSTRRTTRGGHGIKQQQQIKNKQQQKKEKERQQVIEYFNISYTKRIPKSSLYSLYEERRLSKNRLRSTTRDTLASDAERAAGAGGDDDEDRSPSGGRMGRERFSRPFSADNDDTEDQSLMLEAVCDTVDDLMLLWEGTKEKAVQRALAAKEEELEALREEYLAQLPNGKEAANRTPNAQLSDETEEEIEAKGDEQKDAGEDVEEEALLNTVGETTPPVGEDEDEDDGAPLPAEDGVPLTTLTAEVFAPDVMADTGLVEDPQRSSALAAPEEEDVAPPPQVPPLAMVSTPPLPRSAQPSEEEKEDEGESSSPTTGHIGPVAASFQPTPSVSCIAVAARSPAAEATEELVRLCVWSNWNPNADLETMRTLRDCVQRRACVVYRGGMGEGGIDASTPALPETKTNDVGTAPSEAKPNRNDSWNPVLTDAAGDAQDAVAYPNAPFTSYCPLFIAQRHTGLSNGCQERDEKQQSLSLQASEGDAGCKERIRSWSPLPCQGSHEGGNRRSVPPAEEGGHPPSEPRQDLAVVSQMLHVILERVRRHPEDRIDWAQEHRFGAHCISYAAYCGVLNVWWDALHEANLMEAVLTSLVRAQQRGGKKKDDDGASLFSHTHLPWGVPLSKRIVLTEGVHQEDWEQMSTLDRQFFTRYFTDIHIDIERGMAYIQTDIRYRIFRIKTTTTTQKPPPPPPPPTTTTTKPKTTACCDSLSLRALRLSFYVCFASFRREKAPHLCLFDEEQLVCLLSLAYIRVSLLRWRAIRLSLKNGPHSFIHLFIYYYLLLLLGEEKLDMIHGKMHNPLFTQHISLQLRAKALFPSALIEAYKGTVGSTRCQSPGKSEVTLRQRDGLGMGLKVGRSSPGTSEGPASENFPWAFLTQERWIKVPILSRAWVQTPLSSVFFFLTELSSTG
eukprot:gene7698-5400_t